MAARKSSRINRKYKTKYRIRNCSEYDRDLRNRGDFTIRLSNSNTSIPNQPTPAGEALNR